MKNVEIHYVAMLRERAGQSTENVLTMAGDVGTLFDELAARHQWPWTRSSFRPAINHQIATWSDAVTSGDHVLFLPPSSGG